MGDKLVPKMKDIILRDDPLNGKYQITSKDIEDMCAAVGNGSTTSEFCRSRGLDHGDFMMVMRQRSSNRILLEQAKIDRQEWLKESIIEIIQNMISFDPRRAYDEAGNILPMNKLPDDIAYMIKRSQTVRVSNGPNEAPDIVDKLEFWDKQKAIDQLGKHLQMFIEKIEHKHELTLEESIAKARREDKAE